MNKLYILRVTVPVNYNETSGMVVSASNATAARKIARAGGLRSIYNDVKKSTCMQLKPYNETTIIMEDFLSA